MIVYHKTNLAQLCSALFCSAPLGSARLGLAQRSANTRDSMHAIIYLLRTCIYFDSPNIYLFLLDIWYTIESDVKWRDLKKERNSDTHKLKCKEKNGIEFKLKKAVVGWLMTIETIVCTFLSRKFAILSKATFHVGDDMCSEKSKFKKIIFNNSLWIFCDIERWHEAPTQPIVNVTVSY